MNEFKLEGKATEVFVVDDEKNNYKALRIMDVDVMGADVALELTSVDINGEHNLLENFIDKNIEIVIRIKE